MACDCLNNNGTCLDFEAGADNASACDEKTGMCLKPNASSLKDCDDYDESDYCETCGNNLEYCDCSDEELEDNDW